MKELGSVISIILIAAIIVGVVWFMLKGLGDSFEELGKAMNRQHNARAKCLAAGYSDWDWAGGQYYCTRLVDGTEQVVPLEKVE